MFEWIAANLATLIIGLAVLLLIVFIVTRLIRQKKSGRPACGSCSGCASREYCQTEKKDDKKAG